MNDLLKKRRFKLWSYHRSMSTLLLRGFLEDEGGDGIVDVTFVDVRYFEIVENLGEIYISSGTPDDLSHLQKITGKNADISNVWVISSNNRRFLVFATSLFIKEFNGKYYQLPWEVSNREE